MPELPKSMEVLTEEFYDLCAWLRDHQWGEMPEHFALAITRRYARYGPVQMPDGETVEMDYVVEIEVKRFPDGLLHVHGPGVCVDIDMGLLEQKRPRRAA